MRLFMLLAIYLLTTSCFGVDVIPISKIDDVFSHEEYLEKDSLVVFDIDETLTITNHPVFQRANIDQHKQVYRDLLRHLSTEQKILLQSISLTLSKTHLIEDQIIDHILKAQNKGARVIALTACMASRLNNVDLPKWRYDELKRLGIDLKRSFPNLDSFRMENLEPMYGTYPMYESGVILANGNKNSKGEVLAEFLSRVDWKPKSLIFVDDKAENVISVLQTMERLQVPCKGFHYTGGKKNRTVVFDDEDILIKELMKVVNLTLVTHNELVLK